MLQADFPPTTIVALQRLTEQGVVPGILDAQLLSASELITQEQPGPIRATERGREVLASWLASGALDAPSNRCR